MTNWPQLLRELADAGARLTESGARAARIRTRCAWCQKLIHDGPLSPAGKESHGICGACERQFRQDGDLPERARIAGAL